MKTSKKSRKILSAKSQHPGDRDRDLKILNLSPENPEIPEIRDFLSRGILISGIGIFFRWMGYRDKKPTLVKSS